jgi:hypothetical protein
MPDYPPRAGRTGSTHRPPSGRAVLAYAFLAGMAAYALLMQVALVLAEAVAP